MFFRAPLRHLFSKITKQQVISSSYDELAALIAKKYSDKQFSKSNAICLHQIQHKYNVIRSGDWILDVGAGPDFDWSDLALKFAENDKRTHRIVSNDVIETSRILSNQIYVRGSFLEEPVRTNIAMKIMDKKLDAILVDASPTYTGNIQEDGAKLNQIIFEAMYFGNIFLQKGGNFICKVLNCESSKILEQTARIFFHQFFIFKPSVIRDNSPIQFFIMKGFGMNYQLTAMKEFLARYKGSSKNKVQIVKEYQRKYSWDPIQILRNKVKHDVLNMKMQQRSEKDIQNIFKDDPFVKIHDILKQIKILDKAKSAGDQIGLKKALNKFTDGKMYSQELQIPTTRQQWINYLQKLQTQMKQQKRGKKQQKKTNNMQPLRDNEVYMKQQNQIPDEIPSFVYLPGDLQGKYEQTYEDEYILQELQKMETNNPLLRERIEGIKKGIKNKAPIQDIFSPESIKEQQAMLQKTLHNFGEALEYISDSQFKRLLEKQGYANQLQQMAAQRQRSKSGKFRNR